MEGTSEDLPLPLLFTRVRRVADNAEQLSPSNEQHLQLAHSALSHLRQCEAQVERLALFSSNEDADDVATPHLKYLLLPYYAAQLLAAAAPPAPQERRDALLAAVKYYSRYLDTGAQYGVLGAAAAAAVDGGGERAMADAAARRQLKIQRYKREKALREEIAALEASGKCSGGADEGDEDEGGGGDEEDERRLWLRHLELAAIRAAAQRDGLAEEAAIIAHMQQLPPERRAAPPPSVRPEFMAQLSSAVATLQGAPLQGAPLQGDRERLAAQVFRPSHNLPTMSLRELADIEMQRSEEAAQRQREAEAARAAVDPDAASDDDAEIARRRAWDDFRDDNPRGHGNRKNMG